MDELCRYDANGNMTSRPGGGGPQTLGYEYENRLVTITGGSTASFAYDADGNRVWQDVDGTEIHYVWDWVESGTVYYYFGGRKVAMRGAGGVSYLYADQVSSTTNTSHGQTSSQLYYPYGDKRSTGSVATPYRYTGQRWEDAIGLYFYNARWYDPTLGRFIQPDTIVPQPGNPQDLNRYTYAGNNPITYNDPSGHAREAGTGQGLDERYWEIQERLQSLDLRNDLERDIASFLLWEGSYPIPEPTGAFSYAGFGMSLQIVLEQLAGVEPTSDWQKFWHDPELYVGMGIGLSGAILGTGNKEHIVYLARDEQGNVAYVGRTSQDISARQAQHRRVKGRENWNLEAIYESLSYGEARLLEQRLYDYQIEKGANLANKIRPMSDANYQRYLERYGYILPK
jgi:RHS repeat-associated protein